MKLTTKQLKAMIREAINEARPSLRRSKEVQEMISLAARLWNKIDYVQQSTPEGSYERDELSALKNAVDKIDRALERLYK